MTIIDKFISYLTPGRFEGLVLYMVSIMILTAVMVINRKDILEGLKGENKLFEGTEILLFISLWLLPCIVFAAVFLQLPIPEMVWYTIWIIIVVAIFGKWGLNWILAFKTGQSSVTTTVEQKTVVKEEKTEQPQQ